MRYLPQDPFLDISSSWGKSHPENSTDLKFPVWSRWFLSVGPVTQETRRSPWRLPNSDGAVAFQRAAIRSIWKGHGQQEPCPISTLIREWENHQTRLNGGWEAVQWTFPLDGLCDRAKRACSTKREMIRPEGRQPRIVFPVNELFERAT